MPPPAASAALLPAASSGCFVSCCSGWFLATAAPAAAAAVELPAAGLNRLGDICWNSCCCCSCATLVLGPAKSLPLLPPGLLPLAFSRCRLVQGASAARASSLLSGLPRVVAASRGVEMKLAAANGLPMAGPGGPPEVGDVMPDAAAAAVPAAGSAAAAAAARAAALSVSGFTPLAAASSCCLLANPTTASSRRAADLICSGIAAAAAAAASCCCCCPGTQAGLSGDVPCAAAPRRMPVHKAPTPRPPPRPPRPGLAAMPARAAAVTPRSDPGVCLLLHTAPCRLCSDRGVTCAPRRDMPTPQPAPSVGAREPRRTPPLALTPAAPAADGCMALWGPAEPRPACRSAEPMGGRGDVRNMSVGVLLAASSEAMNRLLGVMSCRQVPPPAVLPNRLVTPAAPISASARPPAAAAGSAPARWWPCC